MAYNIYSNRDYDHAHAAGSSLNDVFTTTDIPQRSFDSDGQNEEMCKFQVTAAPADTGRHTFTIKLAQKDGDTLSVSTPSIKLR